MRLVLLFLCTTLAACGGNVFTVDDLVRLPLDGGDADPPPGDDASAAPDSRVGATWDAGDHEAAPDVGLEGGGNLPGDAGSDSESTTDSGFVASDSGDNDSAACTFSPPWDCGGQLITAPTQFCASVPGTDGGPVYSVRYIAMMCTTSCSMYTCDCLNNAGYTGSVCGGRAFQCTNTQGHMLLTCIN